MDEEELKKIEEDCQQFKNVIKTVFYDIDKQINNIQHNIKRYARP